MSRSKKNWDELIDFYGNYNDVDRNIGVSRIIAGEAIVISPPQGTGDVRISLDSSAALQKGDEISDLDNNVGYIKGIDRLDDIGDVAAASPKRGQVLTWTGSSWSPQLSAIPDTFKYRGQRDVSVDHPEADPEEGWTYVQKGGDGVTPLASWVGIETETVNINDLIIYATTGWTVVKGAFDAAGFDDLNAQNSPTPEAGYPGGYLEYDANTASFTFYPADLGELPDLTDPTPQPGTLDDRYVNVVGDTMTGPLTMSGQNIESAGDLRLEGALYLNGVNTVGNDNVRSVIAEGGVLDFGLRDTPLASTFIGVSVRRHTNDKVYLHLAEEPVLPTMAVPLSFLMDTLSDLEDDLDDKYVLVAGDTMTGKLVFDNVGDSIQFNGDSGVDIEGDKTLTFSNSGSPRLVLKQTEVVVKNKPLRVQNIDNSYSFTVSPGSDVDDGVASYSGQILNATDLVNKKYVNDEDEVISQAVDDLNTKVDNLELGIPEADADLKYLHDIVVKDTIQVAFDQPADVIVEDKNKLTFEIPEGAKGDKGEKGERGFKGDRGPNGADGNIGVDGEKGDPGTDGNDGDKGATGADGKGGAKGDKGQKGAASSNSGNYVTRGNTGSDIRIYYSSGVYYIAGTS